MQLIKILLPELNDIDIFQFRLRLPSGLLFDSEKLILASQLYNDQTLIFENKPLPKKGEIYIKVQLINPEIVFLFIL